MEKQSAQQTTMPVNTEIFKAVYNSPASLPGKQKWITKEEDVRTIEKILGMPDKTIGAPLWVSGDRKTCPKCKREINWLDIVDSALSNVHSKEMIAKVILGDIKFVNIEAPRAIKDLHCFKCKSSVTNLRSFKCHNWAYAKPALLKVIKEMEKKK